MEVHASNAGSTCADRSADVKRCYVIRNALALLDFEDESIGDLKRLLLRAAFSPIFLRCKEGRRYLAHLFTLEVRFLGSEALLAAPVKTGNKIMTPAQQAMPIKKGLSRP